MKLSRILPLSLIPLLLVGCSSVTETPNFADNPKVTSSESYQENMANSPIGEKEGDTNNKDTSYKLSEEEKKKGVKLDSNGNPYVDHLVVDGTINEDNAKTKKNNSSETRKSKKEESLNLEEDVYTPSSKDNLSVTQLANSYIDNIKKKQWDKACDKIWLDDLSKKECIKLLEDTYGKGDNFIKYSEDNINSSLKTKEFLSISIADKVYEEAQPMSFIKTKEGWKIFFKG